MFVFVDCYLVLVRHGIVLVVGEIFVLDLLPEPGDGGVVVSAQAAGEWVPASHRQLENQHRQSEAIVVLRSVCLLETFSLESWRGVFVPSYRASVCVVALGVVNLDGVDVNNSYGSVTVDQDVFFVDVSYDMSCCVDLCDCRAEFSRCRY